MKQIGDEQIAAVLRVFERRCAPMLERIRRGEEPDPAPDDPEVDKALLTGALDAIKDRVSKIAMPGTAAWHQQSVQDRSDWWIAKVGRLTALAASVTGLAGMIGDRFPLQDLIGSAGQGLLLCAIASEHRVDDPGTRVRLLASVLFDRDLDPAIAAASPDPELLAGFDTDDDSLAAVEVSLTKPPAQGDRPDTPDSPADPPGRKLGLRAAASWLRAQGRLLKQIEDELDKRPKGRIYHRALGKIPVVGMAGDYLGERSALKRAAKAANRWIIDNTAPEPKRG